VTQITIINSFKVDLLWLLPLFLKPREIDIIHLRMAGKTLREIGEELSVSGTRANQILAQAAHKIKYFIKLEGK